MKSYRRLAFSSRLEDITLSMLLVLAAGSDRMRASRYSWRTASSENPAVCKVIVSVNTEQCKLYCE